VESACYAAKARGRNCVEIYQPDGVATSRLIADSKWANQIKEAIREERLELWFQPVVHIASGRTEFYEGLVRFRDEHNEIVLPPVFLPSVERSGGILMMDRYIIGQAVAALSKIPEVTFSINVSGKSINDPSFVDHVIQLFANNNISPERLIFEIPENVMINLQQVWRMVDLLKAEGFRFALDDFGAGFCSIAYLKELPVDMLKIDGSFIKGLPGQPMNQALVRSLNETGHILKLHTVAEFVENQETLDILKEIGVDYAQGYFLGRPCSDLCPA
jgi:EAL domain-containing protein (putative c-di-GMP-specific phosphodiesterase class I)